jgi:hypothetical protein
MIQLGGKYYTTFSLNLVYQGRLIKMCLNETCGKIRIGKHLSCAFPIKNGLKQGGALSPLLFNFALEQGFLTFFECRHTSTHGETSTPTFHSIRKENT